MRSTPAARVATLLLLSLTTATAQTAATRIATAAKTFLSTLDQKQRQRVLFAFDDDTQRARWSNLPTSFVPRAGLSLKEMNPAQRSAAMDLVASALSPRGFEKVQQIMEGDEVNKTKEGNNPIFGKDLYYISILGTPSEKDPWMLQFGGHHLALNITIAGERGILTPTLTGAQPALYTLNGKTVRPLGQESDKAFALLNALDESQRKQAILSYRLADLVLGPGQDGKTIQPEGLKASAMNDRQRAMLLDAISEWANIVHAERRRGPYGRTESRHQRDLVRVERPDHRYSGQQHHSLLPDSGTASRHRVRASAAGRRSGFARPHHVPRSDERLRQEAQCQMKGKLAAAVCFPVGRDACARAQAR